MFLWFSSANQSENWITSVWQKFRCHRRWYSLRVLLRTILISLGSKTTFRKVGKPHGKCWSIETRPAPWCYPRHHCRAQIYWKAQQSKLAFIEILDYKVWLWFQKLTEVRVLPIHSHQPVSGDLRVAGVWVVPGPTKGQIVENLLHEFFSLVHEQVVKSSCLLFLLTIFNSRDDSYQTSCVKRPTWR